LVGGVVLDESQIDLDSGINLDGGDVLKVIIGASEIDHSLEDSHLESVPGVSTLSARSLSASDLQDLGGNSDGSLNLNVGEVLGSVDELSGD
jgi:hypothetical protein